MNLWIPLIAALSGYLLGSISFTRIMLPRLAPGTRLEEIEERVPGTSETFSSSSSGATAILHQVNAKWGAITALFDILVALFPVLLFKLLFPNTYFFLITAITAMLGHNYPIYYKFKGGRGLSTMIGGFLVFDFFGTILTSILGITIGVLSGQVVLIRWTGIILMIPWVWLSHSEWQPQLYVILANAIFWYSMRGELKRFLTLKRQNKLPDQKVVAEFMGMGSMVRLIHRYSIPTLVKRLKESSSNSIS